MSVLVLSKHDAMLEFDFRPIHSVLCLASLPEEVGLICNVMTFCSINSSHHCSVKTILLFSSRLAAEV